MNYSVVAYPENVAFLFLSNAFKRLIPQNCGVCQTAAPTFLQILDPPLSYICIIHQDDVGNSGQGELFVFYTFYLP